MTHNPTNKDPPRGDPEKACPLKTIPTPPTGVVQTAVGADGESFIIDYDPRLISDESVRQVAERLAPEMLEARKTRFSAQRSCEATRA